MNRVLEAIAAERSELTGRLAALEEMERICIAAVGEQMYVAKLEVKEPPKPRAKRREPVRALPPARRSQPQPRRAQASPSEMKQRAQQVLAALRDLEPCKLSTLAERTGLPAHMVKLALVRLRDEGLVRHTGPKNKHGLWHLTATLDRQTAEKQAVGVIKPSVRCRDDILATIRSEPDAWTEQRITDAGAWDREQVADACGYLLEDGLIVLNGDGTYRPAVLGLEAAA